LSTGCTHFHFHCLGVNPVLGLFAQQAPLAFHWDLLKVRLCSVDFRNGVAQPVQDVVGLCAGVPVASFGLNAAAPETKFAVASPNFGVGAYRRRTRPGSLCFEEK
jgi:hypothetical protein